MRSNDTNKAKNQYDEVAAKEYEEENKKAHTDSSELEELECRAINQSKWCTCRKLFKFVQKQLGKFGLFIPRCLRCNEH
ncbi:hypothetical protein BIW11_06344 [Tropilaelaps mercedesae]|uniref:Uncharacterized protein n=1 Tax=Tropilaelaps mercedesae TaxID=418985 RepID=A0A1V9XYH2_9ACAR|nr:hypothetical protein BIW11_06344 [Tropilaelaps mercedesae]